MSKFLSKNAPKDCQQNGCHDNTYQIFQIFFQKIMSNRKILKVRKNWNDSIVFLRLQWQQNGITAF